MLRMVYTDYTASSTNLLKNAKAMSVYKRVEYNTVLQVFKCLHGDAPEYLTHMFNVRIVNGYQLRVNDSGCLNVPRPRTTHFKQSFSHAGAITWNALPLNAKNAATLCEFKGASKQHYIDIS